MLFNHGRVSLRLVNNQPLCRQCCTRLF
jgi:hypothetical protein